MTEATLLPFDLPAVQRKKLTVDFDGGSQSSDGGLLLLREAERALGICARLAGSLIDRRDAATRTATISTGCVRPAAQAGRRPLSRERA